jgi:hypothetical protein
MSSSGAALDREEMDARVRAVKSGRRLGNMVEVLVWPLTEVQLFLNCRSRTLSLHYEEHALLERTENRVIFEDRASPAPNQWVGDA